LSLIEIIEVQFLGLVVGNGGYTYVVVDHILGRGVNHSSEMDLFTIAQKPSEGA
jgi:hypothetical protein